MNVKVAVDFNKNKIMSVRGLGSSKAAQKFLASDIKKRSDPYTPFQQGTLQNTATIAADGSEIVYVAPYAHYQWYGQVMGGRAPKHYTGDALTYNGAPTRGARWTERMMADKRAEVEKSVELFIAKKGG